MTEPKDLALPGPGQALAERPYEAWERQPRETDRNWHAFLCYRDMAYPQGKVGPYEPRNIRTIAREMGWSEEHARHCAHSFQWVSRVAAYDRVIDLEKAQAGRTVLAKMADEHAYVLSQGMQIVKLEMAKRLSISMDPAAPAMRPGELISFTEMLIKHERLITGQSTDNNVPAQGSIDLSKLPMNDLETLLDIAKRSAGIEQADAQAIDTEGE